MKLLVIVAIALVAGTARADPNAAVMIEGRMNTFVGGADPVVGAAIGADRFVDRALGVGATLQVGERDGFAIRLGWDYNDAPYHGDPQESYDHAQHLAVAGIAYTTQFSRIVFASIGVGGGVLHVSDTCRYETGGLFPGFDCASTTKMYGVGVLDVSLGFDLARIDEHSSLAFIVGAALAVPASGQGALPLRFGVAYHYR
jgi:hypothetical protein